MSDDLYKRFVTGGGGGASMTANVGDPFVSPVRPGEIPLLTPELLKEIRLQLASEPDLTLTLAQRVFDRTMTENELHRLLDELDAAFKTPPIAIAAANLTAESGPPIPQDFEFPGMETLQVPSFRHRPYDTKFENADKLGYGLNGAAAILKRVFVSPLISFRWHDEFPSQFQYPIPKNAKVALFADFGTGLAHSWYIAKFIESHKPQLAVHLGDTYYAGRQDEQTNFFEAPLMSYVTGHSEAKNQELWCLGGNHDYYSGGAAFFNSIDNRRKGKLGDKTFRPHRQVGTYFALDSDAFKIIAIDVEYHSFFGVNPKYKEPRLKAWLEHHVLEAKSAGKSVILLSADEPYSICSHEITDLYHHITDSLPPDAIDMWFWGNTHYAAFFDHSEQLRSKFYGSCIGHGGFPYGTRNKLAPLPSHVAPYRWAETEPRYPRWTEVRPDMGNNGFAIMDLDDANHAVKLSYYDWTNDLRCSVKLAKAPDGQLKASMIAGQKRALHRKATPL